MRKSPDIEVRKCTLCGNEYKPTGNRQVYCVECRKIKRKEALKRYELKKYPNRKPKKKCDEVCCACGGSFSVWFDGKPYCNKHYLRMRNNGDLLPHPREKTNTYIVNGDVLEVVTAKGDSFICDAEDKERVERHSWCKNKSGGYFVANMNGKVVRLSRFILGVDDKEIVVDHINGNISDNRKANLRRCTQKENARNCKRQYSKSGITGVRKTKYGKYSARIVVDRKEIYLGTYKSKEEAEHARKEAEVKYFGEFAPTLSRAI